MTLAEKIYQARKKAGLSQEALADALGVTRQAVSKWETGKSVPDTENIRRMALILAVSADYFLGDTAKIPADNPSGAVPPEKPDRATISLPTDASTTGNKAYLPKADRIFKSFTGRETAS